MFHLVNSSSSPSYSRIKNGHTIKVSRYKQYLDKLNNQEFDLTNGFKCGVVHNLEKLNSLSENRFGLSSYHGGYEQKQKEIPK